MKPIKCSHQINSISNCDTTKKKERAVCGLDRLGVKFDFNLECQACLAKEI